MFSATFFSEHKGEVKTLKLTQNPFLRGLGTYTDVEGIQWDIKSMVGKSYSPSGKAYVNARRISDNPSYYSTAADSSQNGHHEWKPYYFEIIK